MTELENVLRGLHTAAKYRGHYPSNEDYLGFLLSTIEDVKDMDLEIKRLESEVEELRDN